MLLDAGELVQGLLDAELHRYGFEAGGAVRDACDRLMRNIAEAWLRGTVPPPLSAYAHLRRELPEVVRVVRPEGYAYYSVYPELYVSAARELPAGCGPVCVVGLRSIGTSLAPAVAAAVGGAPVLLLRPGGPPYARTLSVSHRLALEPLHARTVAVVDEGPGLSGSSFGCVADWLEGHGVSMDRVVFFPSHEGAPGPHASARHRARWSRARRFVEVVDERFVRERVLGDPDARVRDLGAGQWRAIAWRDEARWPGVHVGQERRKYLLEQRGQKRLLKFAGLGRYGEESYARARRLAELGHTPAVTGLAHGFLLGDWLDGERPWPEIEPGVRARLLDAAGRYLATLARDFRADTGARGASPRELFDMARCNTARGLGPPHARELDRFYRELPELESRVRPLLSDNKMHAWEWLLLPDGRVRKCDALDHHASHDLVGAQDVAWDLAGARFELGLGRDETAALIHRVERAGDASGVATRLPFFSIAYLAFQLGHHTLALEALGDDRREAPRLRAAVERYSNLLRNEIEGVT